MRGRYLTGVQLCSLVWDSIQFTVTESVWKNAVELELSDDYLKVGWHCTLNLKEPFQNQIHSAMDSAVIHGQNNIVFHIGAKS